MSDISNNVYIYKGKVIEVVDGDTVKVDIDLGFNASIKVTSRVLNLDTPEFTKSSCLEEQYRGRLAISEAKDILLGKHIILISKKRKSTDSFGRYLFQIFYKQNGIWKEYSVTMIENGHEKSKFYGDIKSRYFSEKRYFNNLRYSYEKSILENKAKIFKELYSYEYIK